MRNVGVVARGIRIPIVRAGDNLEDIVVDSLLQAAKSDNIVFKDKDKPITASGDKVNAGYIQLPLINILGYEGKFWPFQVIIDNDKDFRNLLGRDLLTGFNYDFNNDNDILSVKRTNMFKPRFKFLPQQEINEVEMIS